MDREFVRGLIGDLDHAELSLSGIRRRVQDVCPHPAFTTAYETETGDREGLSGEYIDTCMDCGCKEPAGRLRRPSNDKG